MFYERKIKYLDYLQNGERISGAGFVKMEVRETACNAVIQISGLPQMIAGDREILLLNEKSEEQLGSIKMEKGRGSLILQGLRRSAMGQSSISYDSLMGIRIPLSGNTEIYCAWRKEALKPFESGKWEQEEKKTALESSLALENHFAPESSLAPGNESTSENSFTAEPEILLKDFSADSSAQEDVPVQSSQSLPEEDCAPEKSIIQGRLAEKDACFRRKPHILQENKWQQLTEIYPHIRPFRDERDYLSIGPADFVILPERYYKMANNSFLLHGYYNYEHLILTKVERRGEMRYYIGVPGNFYDREKQVAVMFGFESFECMEEPARQGDFGYYMMRLEL